MSRRYRTSLTSISRIDKNDGNDDYDDNVDYYRYQDDQHNHQQFSRNDEFLQSFHNQLKRLTDQMAQMTEQMQNMTDTINSMTLSLQYLTCNFSLFMNGSSPSRLNSTTILIDDDTTSRSFGGGGGSNFMHTFSHNGNNNVMNSMINRNESIEQIRQRSPSNDEHESIHIERQRSFVVSDNDEEDIFEEKSLDRSNYRFFRNKQNNEMAKKPTPMKQTQKKLSISTADNIVVVDHPKINKVSEVKKPNKRQTKQQKQPTVSTIANQANNDDPYEFPSTNTKEKNRRGKSKTTKVKKSVKKRS
ncbi:uncharacterized protein LOC113788919 isoform X1 [Dermatophagoides pteronyssinus]|uniref:uncharacterized protein LOC113788919 isoform X1 n=1 Tax=Dermatophagoides pteronyssinus TaxID=6956 RepID=UPI003F6660E9